MVLAETRAAKTSAVQTRKASINCPVMSKYPPTPTYSSAVSVLTIATCNAPASLRLKVVPISAAISTRPNNAPMAGIPQMTATIKNRRI